jgi:hypothetical protein
MRSGSASPGRYGPRALKARRRGGPSFGTAITRADREGYRPASSAGIARDAHAGSSVACADFPGRQAVFLTAADQDAAEGIREELAAAAAGPGARNGVSQFLRALTDVPG